MSTLEQEVFEALYLIKLVGAGDGRVDYFDSEGRYHRDFGPAVIWPDGDFDWLWRGMNHRVGGHARNRSSIGEGFEYWLFDYEFTEEDYLIECEKRTLPQWKEYDEYVRTRSF